MDDDTSLIALLFLLMCFYFLLIKLDTDPRAGVNKKEIANHKKNLRQGLLQQFTDGTNIDTDKSMSRVEESLPQSARSESWNTMQFSRAYTDVASETIDELAEYQVFKELGYIQQAARTLERVLISNPVYRTSDYIMPLGQLYSEVKKVSKLAELLENYWEDLSEEDIQKLIRKGFSVEPTNYRLQLFCTKILKIEPTDLGAVVNN